MRVRLSEWTYRDDPEWHGVIVEGIHEIGLHHGFVDESVEGIREEIEPCVDGRQCNEYPPIHIIERMIRTPHALIIIIIGSRRIILRIDLIVTTIVV